MLVSLQAKTEQYEQGIFQIESLCSAYTSFL